jgi:hypothetical protein
MIVRKEVDALLFITQPDHARLADALLAEWRQDGFPAHPRRTSLLLAAREHDNGWRELDESLVFDRGSGQLLDFLNAPDAVKQSVWPTGVERIADPYAAALVARHATYVYNSHADEPSWSAFFDTMRTRQRDLLERAGIDQATLDADYRFLSVVDLLSLSFCCGWTDEHERFGCRVRCEGEMLRVDPPVLGEEPLAIRVRARRLAVRTFGSAADARAALDAAPLEIVEGTAAPARGRRG